MCHYDAIKIDDICGARDTWHVTPCHVVSPWYSLAVLSPRVNNNKYATEFVLLRECRFKIISQSDIFQLKEISRFQNMDDDFWSIHPRQPALLSHYVMYVQYQHTPYPAPDLCAHCTAHTPPSPARVTLLGHWTVNKHTDLDENVTKTWLCHSCQQHFIVTTANVQQRHS